MSGAKFPVLKDIGKFVFADTAIDADRVRELATGSFLDARRNMIFIGGTGTGKTHPCIGVAAAVVRARAKGRFFNLVDLVNQLEQEKAAGRTGRLAEKLLRYDLIAINELGYLPFSQPSGQLLFPLDQQAVRKHVVVDHHQSSFCRLAAGIRRRSDDHCHARSPDASLRHHRDRQ
jgi:DNA replication protein DnaC